MKFQKTLFLFLLCSFLFQSCKKEQKQAILKETTTSVKHAQGFDILPFKDYKKLIIKAPYPEAKEQFEYVLIPKGKEIPVTLKGFNIIRTPIEQLVVTSTTHIPMLELLQQEKSLVGFPNTQYISSAKTKALITSGSVKELGKEQSINTEVLLDLQPELVVGFSMISNNKMFTTIEKAGIPVILNGDWLEGTPLGRAEWIKFFGVLFDKEHEADRIFNAIENEYTKAVNIAKNAKSKPTILSGVQFKDVWNLPAGDSFVAQFLKDANTDYLWADTKGKGSLALSFEAVFEKAKDAQLWIAPGHYSSYSQLKEANNHYAEFDAFTKKNVYSFNNRKGENGGVLYYELAPVQPHIVLKDIIKIVHPELLPNYTPYFLAQLQD
jgi:iron complex transport system substrate-binding protein